MTGKTTKEILDEIDKALNHALMNNLYTQSETRDRIYCDFWKNFNQYLETDEK